MDSGHKYGVALENSVAIPERLSIELLYYPEIRLLGIYPRVNGNTDPHKNLNMNVHNIMITLAAKWKHLKCLSTDELIHIMEYYAAIKGMEY